jgi:cyclic beta-1,2-glucan synthetase
VILPLKLPAHREANVRFILTYGQTEHAAAHMAEILLHSDKAEKPDKNSFFINTPDKALNQYINHFAPSQIAGSRIYGRCAFYQCGGAYGFRDQLQDVMAYLLIDPALCYRHILRCCAVQFEEGDVFHWWHDLPQNAGGLRGVRTTFSDDLLWLPLAVAEYVEKTGDTSLLSIPCGYLAAEPLPAHEHERYISPERSPLREDVYNHCVRALERGYNLGENGLPLIGCGDWNDGFSSVGLAGKGTSVWLALFLSLVLERFATMSEKTHRADYAATCRERASSLREAVDKHAWDGGWYLRAFYDDGSPMGSHQNDECAVDLLPQSFAVLAAMPDTERVSLAMENAWNHLADAELGLVRLFEQPFHRSGQRPGYVKAYPPGLRENGGQYTHSAIWFALALLKQGETDRAWQVLRWINPAYRATNSALSSRYKLEPYAIAADIYTHPGAPGRGGWSLYTGAAAWYYRAILENLLGMRLQGDRVAFAPHLPAAWPEAGLVATIRDTELTVTIRRGDTPCLTCDGKAAEVVLLDGGRHEVEVVIADATEGSGA